MKDNIPKETANISRPGLCHITGKHFQKAQDELKRWRQAFKILLWNRGSRTVRGKLTINPCRSQGCYVIQLQLQLPFSGIWL